MVQRLTNKSIEDAEVWEQDGLKFTEMIRQGYDGNNCVFSSGMVEGHPVDTVYLKWQRDSDDGGMLILRPDELAAIAWVATGTLWSELLSQLD